MPRRRQNPAAATRREERTRPVLAPPRVALSLVAALASGGCSVVLGLDGYTFDLEPDAGDGGRRMDGGVAMDAGRSDGGPTMGCGDGTVQAPEACDDGNTDGGDGCSATCTVEDGWDCSGGSCTEICGDAMVVGSEACDDGVRRVQRGLHRGGQRLDVRGRRDLRGLRGVRRWQPR